MMTRAEIELYAMRRGMNSHQAKLFADHCLAQRRRPDSHDYLALLIVPFAATLGIALIALDTVVDISSSAVATTIDVCVGVLDVGVDVGIDVISSLFDIF